MSPDLDYRFSCMVMDPRLWYCGKLVDFRSLLASRELLWTLRMRNEVEWKVMNEDMLWLSRWIMGNNELECGERVCLAIKEDSGFLTKEIGVQFVYERQNKDKVDMPSSSEDTTIQRERSPWEWTQSFLETTRPRVPGVEETGVQCIHSCDKKVISTVMCAAEYHFCNSDGIERLYRIGS